MIQQTKIYSLILTLAFITLAGLSHSFGLLVTLLANPNYFEQTYLMTLGIFMPLGFIGIPYYLSTKYQLYQEKRVHYSPLFSIILFICILLFNHLYLKSPDFWSQLIVAVCEEFLFRFFILTILLEAFSRRQAIIIGAFLFGILLHINGSILENLLIKVPSGFLLYYLSERFGLQAAIAYHWLHNIFIGTFI